MTSIARPDPARRPVLACAARALALGIAAALLVGLLMVMQSAPIGARASTPIAAEPTPPSPSGAALDAGVDWHLVEAAPEPAGATVAAYEHD